MGRRKVVVRESVAESISKVAWFIESKGLIATADKFSDDAYDFLAALTDDTVIHAPCRDPERNYLGLKCKNFRKKYTIVFIETETEITVCEFLPSKMIHW